MKKVLLILATVCAAGAEEPAALTLPEAVRLALERYPDVAKARAAADVLRGKTREVRADALPHVAINGSYTR